MKQTSLDLLSKSFIDCGKISFAVLVIGPVAHKPFKSEDILLGVVITLTLFLFGIIINQKKEGE